MICRRDYMIIICLITPLLFFAFTTYWFNIRKLQKSKGRIIVLSILETISSYLLVFLLYLQGFYTIFSQAFITLIVFLVVGIAYTYMVKGVDSEWDFQNENIKNNFILFTLIFLPFMIFMTMFRFINPVLQILLSILLTALIVFLSVKIKKVFHPFSKKLDTNFSLVSDAKYLYILLLLLVVMFLGSIFHFPFHSVSRFLNLYDTTPFLSMDGFPIDIQNNYREQTTLEIDVDMFINKEGVDYYYDTQYLYLYNKTHVYVFDIQTNSLYNSFEMGNYNANLDSSIFYGLYRSFIKHNDDLILLGVQGVFVITPDSSTKISDINSNYARAYFYQDDLYFLSKRISNYYKVYRYSDEQIILDETIDLSLEDFDDIEVISEQLFYKEDDRIISKDDSNISFLYYDGTATYDANNEVMYYVRVNSDLFTYTNYFKVNQNDEVQNIEINREHNINSMFIDNTLYLTNFNEIEDNRIEMINQDFEISGFKNMFDRQAFWVGNFYIEQYIVNFHSTNDQLEYLKIDSNLSHSLIEVVILSQEPVALELPFYSHYGIGYFIPILIILFIPITDYRKFHVILSFEEATKKRDEE